MKKILAGLLCIIVTQQTFATIRRVGFIATVQAVNGFDYTTFQAAHDASIGGDTIQLYPTTSGAISYTGTITKPLIIQGPGYFYNVFHLTGAEVGNTSLQNLAGSIASCSFTFDLGSANTIIAGLQNITVNVVNRVEPLNNITITRCRNVVVNWDNSSVINGWTINGCYGLAITQSGFSTQFTSDRTIDNLTVTNCFVTGSINFNTSPQGTYQSNRFTNCVFASGHSMALSSHPIAFQNCIFETQSFTGATASSFIRNLTTLAASGNLITNTGANSGNVFSVVLANVFVGYPTMPTTGGVNNFSLDGRLRLRAQGTPINPAIGAGQIVGSSTATDCGIFGGSTPYTVSGVPPIPVFYQLGASSAVTVGNSYIVNFSVRNNN